MRSDWLDAFLVFSETLNFTHAAERLHISQPALHVKIATLAESLGTPLYQRVGRALVLTPAGRKLATHAREIQGRTQEFVAAFRQGAPQQALVLAAGEGAFLYLLGPAIRSFRHGSKRPLRLLTADREHTLEAVAAGRADLGVTTGSALPDGLTATALTRVDQVLVVPRAHRLAGRRHVKLDDLRDEALILPAAGRPHRVAIEQALAGHDLPWTLAVEADGWELMIHFVKLGMGVAVVNACCKVPATLAAIPMPELPALSYYIVERRDGWARPDLDQLKQALLTQRQAWQAGHQS